MADQPPKNASQSTEVSSTETLLSHPAVKFKKLEVVRGPLHRMNKARYKVVKTVARDTLRQLKERDVESILLEALYNERYRIRQIRKFSPSYLFNRNRHVGDRKLWGGVHKGLLKKSSEVNREQLLESVLNHYAEEIAGHFNDRVYRFATNAIPWFFNGLLNAASVQTFLPNKWTESLQGNLRILGEVPHVQKLAQKGTILMVPTHQSNIDSVLIGYVIYLMQLPPFAYGAGLNLFTNPVLNFFMGNLGAYTVDRHKNNLLYKTILKNYSTRILRDGVHSIFFPGGGRARNGALESQLKLGLLGTGLEAQIQNIQNDKPNSSIYVVPMVTSFHFVLEASSLIEDYLSRLGKARFIGSSSEEILPWMRFIKFFWKLFSARSEITVKIGKPLDVFGNFVDEEGHSMGPNGTIIDPKRWLTTEGEVKAVKTRDNEYVRELGQAIVERYYKDNVVISSQVVAFAYFQALRRKYPELDLYRLLRLGRTQRTLQYSDFVRESELVHEELSQLAQRGEVCMADNLKTSNSEAWIKDGVTNIGLFHDLKVLRHEDQAIYTEDMNLLYYYRNRLTGYGLSHLSETGRPKALRGIENEQGFLE